MKAHFDLEITANYETRIAEFSLYNSAGVKIAFHQTDFNAISVSHQRGLFDLRNYLRLFVEPGKEHAVMAEIGVCIAEQVLGKEIFAALYDATSERTLRIQLPGASDTENLFVAALARVPWEIARPKVQSGTLAERNLLVRVVHDMQAPASTPIELAADEPLRVLFVFAESRGSRPLPQFLQRTKPPHPAESVFLSIRQLRHPLENDAFVYLQTLGVVTAPEYADSLIAQPTRPKKPV